MFRMTAPWLDEPVEERDPFRAAAHLAVDLLESYLDENPELLAVHGGCAVLGDKAILFPGAARAGKSTLTGPSALPVFPARRRCPGAVAGRNSTARCRSACISGCACPCPTRQATNCAPTGRALARGRREIRLSRTARQFRPGFRAINAAGCRGAARKEQTARPRHSPPSCRAMGSST